MKLGSPLVGSEVVVQKRKFLYEPGSALRAQRFVVDPPTGEGLAYLEPPFVIGQ